MSYLAAGSSVYLSDCLSICLSYPSVLSVYLSVSWLVGWSVLSFAEHFLSPVPSLPPRVFCPPSPPFTPPSLSNVSTRLPKRITGGRMASCSSTTCPTRKPWTTSPTGWSASGTMLGATACRFVWSVTRYVYLRGIYLPGICWKKQNKKHQLWYRGFQLEDLIESHLRLCKLRTAAWCFDRAKYCCEGFVWLDEGCLFLVEGNKVWQLWISYPSYWVFAQSVSQVGQVTIQIM